MEDSPLSKEPHPESLYNGLRLQDELDFRVLELAPGEPAEPLKCTLSVEALKGTRGYPAYVALSYVWGAPDRTHVLECNGLKILITETLEKALRHLRDRTEKRRLWIDQICIDQSDVQDRTHQLHIMKRIYQMATKVISWLGPDHGDQASLAKALLDRLLNIDEFGRKLPKIVHFPTNQQLKKLQLPLREAPDWTALETLIRHQYFERVWVLQEVRMGREVILVWGGTEIRWDRVSGAYIRAVRHWMQIADPQTNSKPCPTLSLERLEAFMMRPTTWVDLLRATRRFGATDLRDKVFALIGLADGEVLASNYAATLGETYASVAKHIIRTTGDLRVLAYVWIRDLSALDGIPTWAPRWNDIADVNKTPKVLADWTSYSSSGQEKARVGDSEWDILKLEGLVVDEVDCLAPPLDSWDELENDWWKVVAESLRIADPAGRLRGESPDYIMVPFLWTITAGQSLGVNGLTCPATEPQHIEDFVAFAFNGILQNWPSKEKPVCLKEILNLLDCALRSLPALQPTERDNTARPDEDEADAPPMSRRWIEKILRSFHPSDPAAVEMATDIIVRAREKHDTAAVIRFMSQFEVSSVNRRFFVTKKGYMGIGPTYMEKGDVVAVLFGGPTPYVLRPTAGEGEHLFLGECYVDDVMNGEALTLLAKGRRETQWFSLR
ncbi:heterokaryon incompatibility protein-domain-containing protein [Podospora aff. communis PSN243]|uniref:Heterokaryon incompatibility protein-domain-containing protein n=1 Tax=Podospora aff. communis PSN243 TaxID=3040156 RepID=A0AAV9G8H9_9PEZI|nr:heterokaryon incompatibility protein-domain-containing protein [Podospora aff. communis PSN243]